MDETVTRLILQKLDKIDTKQDQIEQKADDMVPAMVRMEERQMVMHAQLVKGETLFKDHTDRIDSLERTRDKGIAVLGIFGTIFTAIGAGTAWLLQNLHLLPKWR